MKQRVVMTSIAVFLIALLAGVSGYTLSAYTGTGTSDQDYLERGNTKLSTEPSGRSVRALAELMLDLTQAVNGEGEQSKARSEAFEVVAQLRSLNIGSTSTAEHRDYENVSILFEKLNKYGARRGQDENARLSCEAAARLFSALSEMENDSLSGDEQEAAASAFFYALADLLDLERTDEKPEEVLQGEVELFRSLGDICKAESANSDRDTKKALQRMFKSLGSIAVEEK